MRIERDQIWTMVALVAMVAGTVGGLWLPMWKHESHLRAALAAVKAAGGQGKTDIHHLEALAQEVADIHKSMETKRRVVPDEADLAGLLKSLSADLASLHVTGQETQSEATVVGSDFSVIPVTLRFRSTFPTVYTFLAKAEAMPRLVRITRLEVLDPTGVAQSHPAAKGRLLNVSIELCTFFAPQDGGKP